MKKVLLIDSNEISAYVNRRMIELSGLTNEINVFRCGRKAFDFLLQTLGTDRVPDVIFVDIAMPATGMNGFDFIRAFHIIGNSTIEIVVISSSNNSKDIRRAFELGIRRYLVTPLLLRDIKEILGS